MHDLLCYSAQDRDGVGVDTLILFPGGGRVEVHTQPTGVRPVQLSAPRHRRGGFSAGGGAYSMQEGPESIVEAMRFCTELERGCNARVVKPDVCINEVEGAYLRAALLDGGVLRSFSGWTERQIRAHWKNFSTTTSSAFRALSKARTCAGASCRRAPCAALP